MIDLLRRICTETLVSINTLNPTSHGRHAITQIASALRLLPDDGIHSIHGLKMDLKIADYIDRSVYFDSYEFLVRKVICRNFLDGGVFIDVGANIGYYSLLAAQRLGPDGRIFAVEASPKTLIRLRENIAANKLSNITVIPFAAGETDGECEIFTPDEHTHGVASLRNQNYGSTQIDKVKIRRLDQFLINLPRVDLVKIDIEGAELGALKGMRDIIVRHQPAILVEIVPNFLQAFGHKAIEIVDFILSANPHYAVWQIEEHRIILRAPEFLRSYTGDWGNFIFSEKHPLRG